MLIHVVTDYVTAYSSVVLNDIIVSFSFPFSQIHSRHRNTAPAQDLEIYSTSSNGPNQQET